MNHHSILKDLNRIAQAIYDKKGFNILSLDVRGISSFAEYFIIAEGNVEKHVQSLAQSVHEKMLEIGYRPLHIEGKKEGDWIVIDYSDVVIHLFIPEMREKYNLEQLWQESTIIDVPIRHQAIR